MYFFFLLITIRPEPIPLTNHSEDIYRHSGLVLPGGHLSQQNSPCRYSFSKHDPVLLKFLCPSVASHCLKTVWCKQSKRWVMNTTGVAWMTEMYLKRIFKRHKTICSSPCLSVTVKALLTSRNKMHGAHIFFHFPVWCLLSILAFGT